MRYLNSQFPRMNHPRLAEENSNKILSSFAKEIGGNYRDQVFYRKNYFLGNYYGKETQPLIWVDTYYRLNEYSHGGCSDDEVSFEDTTDLIQFMQYTLWGTVH